MFADVGLEERLQEEWGSGGEPQNQIHKFPPSFDSKFPALSNVVLHDRAGREKRWTKEEDQSLRIAVQAHPENFALIAAEFFPKTRTEIQCLHRWKHVLSAGLVQGAFSPSEDEQIRGCIRQGITDWNEIMKFLSGRSAKQIRERWNNHLDPSLNHGPWTAEEDRILLASQEKFGNSWKQVSVMLPGRADNSK